MFKLQLSSIYINLLLYDRKHVCLSRYRQLFLYDVIINICYILIYLL